MLRCIARRKPSPDHRGEASLTANVIVGLLVAGGIFAWRYYSEYGGVALADIPPETWVEKDKVEWPRLSLLNDATFNGHSDLVHGAGFIVEREDGEVVAVTARHLLTEEAGVRPSLTGAQLKSGLRRWKMYVPGQPGSSLECREQIGANNDYNGFDIMVLRTGVKRDALDPEMTPLKLFTGRAEVGEKVFVIGAERSQKVLEGKLLSGESRLGYLNVRLDQSIDVLAYSGAPLLNEKGWVIGVVTSAWQWEADDQGRAKRVIAEALRPLGDFFD